MKIVHYSNQLGIGGTEKCMQYFLEYLHGTGYDCYALHDRHQTDAAGGYREKLLQKILGTEKVIAHTTDNDFFSIIEDINPDIFHVHRSGSPNEFPIVPRLRPLIGRCVETNVFGGLDTTDIIDLTLYVNKFQLKAGRSLRRKTKYLFNPVKLPIHQDNLRTALGILPATFVMGRIGRPDDHIFDPISLHALKLIENENNYDILYLVQSPPPAMIEAAKYLGLKKIRFITIPIVSDYDITSFFNTIDILAHVRKDGETFGLSIAEAMIHGKAVISHQSRISNGHRKFVKECGYFARADNYEDYAKYIRILYSNKEKRLALGQRGQDFAKSHFLIDVIGKKLEAFYQSLILDEKNNLSPIKNYFRKRIWDRYFS